MDEVILPFVDTSPETIAKRAAAKATAIDREQARTQARPNFPPVRGEERVPVRVGSIELPFFSSLNDPARITGTHTRMMREFRPRVVECVACEHRKLETRLGDPADHVPQPAKLSPEQRRHFGPGERDYSLCKSCHDTFGTLHPKFFELFAQKRMREDQQRSLRGARNFPDVARRVAEVDRWRREAVAAREFGQVLDANPLGERRARQSGGLYDGGAPTSRVLRSSPGKRDEPQRVAFMPADEGVYHLSDFTDQSAPQSPRRLVAPRRGSRGLEDDAPGQPETGDRRNGRSGVGDPDPTWQSNDAGYDPERVGADHAEAIIADESWEAGRTRIFRRKMGAIERALQMNGDAEEQLLQKAAAEPVEPRKLEDELRRLQLERKGLENRREALYRRWDARLSPSKRNPQVGEVTSPFASVRKSRSPYPRTTLHSGVDEAFAGEPAHVRAAHARHLAAVEEFLDDVRGKLARMGYSEEKIKELTSLPPLEPERIRRYPLDDPPLRERLEAERARARGLHLAPAADLDSIARAAREGEHVHLAREMVATGIAAAAHEAGRTSAEEFIDHAGRVHAREKLVASVREADSAREHVSRWAHSIHRADQDLTAATDAFAREVKVTFHDPRAFQAAFKQLSQDEKRAMLAVLRERPGDFAREFRGAGGHDFGDAGRLARGRRRIPSESTVGERERSGILTAEAGIRYLDAVTSREVVREHAARALGVPDTTGFDGLRNACREQMKEANAKKAAAISERTTLGKVPTRRQLGAAFAGLTQQDRSRVLKEVPGVSGLIEPRGRALARTGHSL